MRALFGALSDMRREGLFDVADQAAPSLRSRSRISKSGFVCASELLNEEIFDYIEKRELLFDILLSFSTATYSRYFRRFFR